MKNKKCYSKILFYLKKWKSFSKKPNFICFFGTITTSRLFKPMVNLNPDWQIFSEVSSKKSISVEKKILSLYS